jgi:hypothetical protein
VDGYPYSCLVSNSVICRGFDVTCVDNTKYKEQVSRVLKLILLAPALHLLLNEPQASIDKWKEEVCHMMGCLNE